MAHPDPGDGKTDTTFGISMKVRKDGRWGGACLPARLPSHGMAPSEVGTAHSAARRLAQGPLPPPPTLAPCEPSQTTTDSDITGRVVEDCVRWMSGHALHREGLFTDPSHVDGKKLLALRKAYEAGKRPLRRSCGPHDPLTLLRRALRSMDGAAQDTLYALFEFLHHHWINQRDRRQALCQLARLFGPLVVGARRGATPAQPACHAALEATAALIADFRRLFVQPMKLQRYLADLDLPDECGEAGAGATDTSSETADATSGPEQETCPDPELVAVLDGMLGDILGVSLAGAAKAAKEPWSPTGIADAGAFELDGMSESSSFSSAEDGEEDSPQRRLWGSRGGCVAGGPPLRLVV
ncbi:hypothetical protein F751_0222 [Auxenochlorella protothecoides]|uniref:Uncharacterized protein n=1 Tax=Auxenochlorella protothecoides TaxID=3075 RepID=A0A087SE84_AUXPR|nr:hypothetical protein F751_0222 [Auxenochlorella protothecoides]KFM24038.1 hypothetical protein F751_0222 [Auxenochlorella protothecoides]